MRYKVPKIHNETILNEILMFFLWETLFLLYFLVYSKILLYQSGNIETLVVVHIKIFSVSCVGNFSASFQLTGYWGIVFESHYNTILICKCFGRRGRMKHHMFGTVNV